MATKTVVCPECGSPAAPGRYACGECGALLASVGLSGRAPAAVAETTDHVSEDVPTPEPAAAAADSEPVQGAASATEPDDSGWDEVDADEPVAAAPVAAAPAPDEPATEEPALEDPAAVAFDEKAPLESARGAGWHPAVLRDLEPPDEAPALAGAMESSGDGPPRSSTVPGWPPPGDIGPIARPEPRTPAGAYLPPSAILPPLDAQSAGGPAASATPATAAAGAAASTSSLSGRASAAFADALESVRIPANAARRAVTVGAGVAALGILLPWVGSLPGSSPFAGYLDRWGLAGAGLWIVLLGLVALTVVAASSGRTASWPVGLPAVAMAAFLVGLVWPDLIGGNRSIGVWVVVVGAIVLVVGGLVGLRRHEGPEPAV